MTSKNKVLTLKLNALHALLDAPRPDDADWSNDLLVALESIYELALRPETQTFAEIRKGCAMAA